MRIPLLLGFTGASFLPYDPIWDDGRLVRQQQLGTEAVPDVEECVGVYLCLWILFTCTGPTGYHPRLGFTVTSKCSPWPTVVPVRARGY